MEALNPFWDSSLFQNFFTCDTSRIFVRAKNFLSSAKMSIMKKEERRGDWDPAKSNIIKKIFIDLTGQFILFWRLYPCSTLAEPPTWPHVVLWSSSKPCWWTREPLRGAECTLDRSIKTPVRQFKGLLNKALPSERNLWLKISDANEPFCYILRQ